MSDKAITKAKRQLKERIKGIQKEPTSEKVTQFNSTLLGIQNYFLNMRLQFTWI
jgi:RNA-directed DNA polymerase